MSEPKTSNPGAYLDRSGHLISPGAKIEELTKEREQLKAANARRLEMCRFEVQRADRAEWERDELRAKLDGLRGQMQSVPDSSVINTLFAEATARAEQAEANLERTDSHLARALGAQIALTTRAEQAEAKWLELQQAINPLMCIVEGCFGERWAVGSRRLVDTKEWCAFHTEWKRLEARLGDVK